MDQTECQVNLVIVKMDPKVKTVKTDRKALEVSN